MPRRPRTERTDVNLEGQTFPLTIHRELRRNLRASLGHRGFILRIPAWLTPAEEEESMQWFRKWAGRKVAEKEGFARQFQRRTYRDGDLLRVGRRQYRLAISRDDRRTHRASLRDGVIGLRLSRADSGASLDKAIRHLLSRTVADDFLPEITARVKRLNAAHFRRPLGRVRLKYNQSNWGSCSARGNINLSTRLLFAPDAVIDYVIVHELAHLVELNHSPAFWALVASVVPDYRDHEAWLKANRHHCDF